MMDEKVKKSAYNKKVDDMNFDELCSILITSDGKGIETKTKALEKIIQMSKMKTITPFGDMEFKGTPPDIAKIIDDNFWDLF